VRLALAILAALILTGCAAGFRVRVGLNIPGGWDPYVEVEVPARLDNDATARAAANAGVRGGE